ncbi:MAG: thioredoxin family protein [Candidatus Bathyarchaeia archaeon]
MGEAYIEMFTSPGCANCPAVKKMLKELSDELVGDITIEEVDITVDPTRAAQYGVMSVPAVAINGILKFVGVVPKREELKKAIAEELEA